MRGMNLLQMLGGVAVAGAVAAGTTAFTASGVSSSVTDIAGGGKATFTVTGTARLTAAAVIADTTDPSLIKGITLTVDNGAGNHLFAGSVVKAAFKGNDAAGAAVTIYTYFSCTNDSSDPTADDHWTCNISGGATNYFSVVSNVSVAVAL